LSRKRTEGNAGKQSVSRYARRTEPYLRDEVRSPIRHAWRRDLLYDHSYLLVKHPSRLTPEEHATLGKLFELDSRLKTLRDFTTGLHQTFEATSARGARNRRTRLFKNRRYLREPLLAKPLKRLRDDEVFGKLVVSLSWDRVPRTSNHVERKNRAFRMVQKTR
jgi:hypothetical protein